LKELIRSGKDRTQKDITRNEACSEGNGRHLLCPEKLLLTAMRTIEILHVATFGRKAVHAFWEKRSGAARDPLPRPIVHNLEPSLAASIMQNDREPYDLSEDAFLTN
jgi:hypothetical protein